MFVSFKRLTNLRIICQEVEEEEAAEEAEYEDEEEENSVEDELAEYYENNFMFY